MAVNLASYARHGTIEFRQHSGSTNANKICNWITFCVHFVSKAIQAQVLPAAQVETSVTPGRIVRRGRRPNYEARRNLLAALMDRVNYPYGCDVYTLARVSGYSATRLGFNSEIFNEIRQFASVNTSYRRRALVNAINNRLS